MRKLICFGLYFISTLTLSSTKGECPISAAPILFDPSVDRNFKNLSALKVVIAGNITGSKQDKIYWTRNGKQILAKEEIGGRFHIGGGEMFEIEGAEMCLDRKYRVALEISGRLPGRYQYTVINSQTPNGLKSDILTLFDADPPTNLVLKQIKHNRVLVTWEKSETSVLDYRVYLNDESLVSDGHATTLTSYVSRAFKFDELINISVRATSPHYWSEILGPKTIIISRVQTPKIHLLKLTSTLAELYFEQPIDTLYANRYKVTYEALSCRKKGDKRSKTFTSNHVTLKQLQTLCSYLISVEAKNTFAELSSDISASLNLTTKTTVLGWIPQVTSVNAILALTVANSSLFACAFFIIASLRILMKMLKTKKQSRTKSIIGKQKEEISKGTIKKENSLNTSVDDNQTKGNSSKGERITSSTSSPSSPSFTEVFSQISSRRSSYS